MRYISLFSVPLMATLMKMMLTADDDEMDATRKQSHMSQAAGCKPHYHDPALASINTKVQAWC